MSMPRVGCKMIMREGLVIGRKYNLIEYTKEMQFKEPLEVIGLHACKDRAWGYSFKLSNGHIYPAKMIKKFHRTKLYKIQETKDTIGYFFNSFGDLKLTDGEIEELTYKIYKIWE